jgi:hypothetical protein
MSTRKKTTKKVENKVENKVEEKVDTKKKEEENVLEEKKKVVRKKTEVQPPPVSIPVSVSVAMNDEPVSSNVVKKKQLLPVSRSTHKSKLPPFVPSPFYKSKEDTFTEFLNLIMKRK